MRATTTARTSAATMIQRAAIEVMRWGYPSSLDANAASGGRSVAAVALGGDVLLVLARLLERLLHSLGHPRWPGDEERVLVEVVAEMLGEELCIDLPSSPGQPGSCVIVRMSRKLPLPSPMEARGEIA